MQVKHVDPETHEALRLRAAAAGVTLGEYVLELIRKDLRRPSRTAWLEQVRALPPLDVDREAVLAELDRGRADR